MIPGPINFDPAVLRALSSPTISHVSTEFAQIFSNAIKNLKKLLFTEKGQPIVVAGSGTLSMEMAVANLAQKADKVLVATTGFFGERFAEIFRVFGADVDQLNFEPKNAASPEMIDEKLTEKHHRIVAVSHVDTSTGSANPIEDIAKVVRDHNSLFMVDGVCATGAMPEKMDEWGIDVIITASQKAIGVPPGLAISVFSERAVEESNKTVKTGVYFASLDRWLPIMRDFEEGKAGYFATPPVNMIYALDKSLELILGEGLDNVFARHKKLSKAFRSAMKGLGLRLVVEDERSAADTMTAVYYPSTIEDTTFRKHVKEEHVTIAGGIGKLAGKTFRVGHMGRITSNDILATIGAIEKALARSGYLTRLGSGLMSGSSVLAGE